MGQDKIIKVGPKSEYLIYLTQDLTIKLESNYVKTVKQKMICNVNVSDYSRGHNNVWMGLVLKKQGWSFSRFYPKNCNFQILFDKWSCIVFYILH
jgi:hypothetical protein